jgi:hypothetical protein
MTPGANKPSMRARIEMQNTILGKLSIAALLSGAKPRQGSTKLKQGTALEGALLQRVED